MGASQVPQVTLTDVNGNPVTVTGGALSTSGGGGGGGAATIADGADIAQGTTTDAETTTGNGTIVSILKRIRTQVTAILAKQPVLGVAGTAATDVITVQGIASAVPQSVSGQMVSIATEVTRPADTTAYAALDVVSDSTSAPTVITFTNVARVNNGNGYVVKARLMSDQTTLTSRLRLHLFHTAPTAINDNSPYTLLYANRANRIGYCDFPAVATEGTGSTAASANIADLRIAFVCAAADRNIYAFLETRDAFTPASGQKFYLELTADLN